MNLALYLLIFDFIAGLLDVDSPDVLKMAIIVILITAVDLNIWQHLNVRLAILSKLLQKHLVKSLIYIIDLYFRSVNYFGRLRLVLDVFDLVHDEAIGHMVKDPTLLI